MTLPLSVLDPSPIPSGSKPSQALHETVRLARAARAGADELIVTTNVHDPAERRESYALLAEAFDLAQDRPGSRTT